MKRPPDKRHTQTHGSLIEMFWRSRGTVFTVCSHKFTLFWLRKTSVIIKTFQWSFHVFVCAFLSGDLFIFSIRVSSFLFLTHIFTDVSVDCDVINVYLGSCIYVHWSMNACIIEKVKCVMEFCITRRISVNKNRLHHQYLNVYYMSIFNSCFKCNINK